MGIPCSRSCVPQAESSKVQKPAQQSHDELRHSLLNIKSLPVQVLPLQVASLLLLTLPWTLPRLLDLQAANPVAVLEGKQCHVLSDNYLNNNVVAALAHSHSKHGKVPCQCEKGLKQTLANTLQDPATPMAS
jgi:hypothetical protein